MGLPLPSESSVWLLSQRKCGAFYSTGDTVVCVRTMLVCFSEHSLSATDNDLWHDLYNTAPKLKVQLLKIHSVSAVTSATTSMNHAVHKYAGKLSTPHRTTVTTLQSPGCPWCLNRAGCVTPSGNVSCRARVCWAVPNCTVQPEIFTAEA